MPEQAKSVARPWRRYLRFSVRGLIVFVLVFGVWLGWIVRRQESSVRQSRESGNRAAFLFTIGSARMAELIGSGRTADLLPASRGHLNASSTLSASITSAMSRLSCCQTRLTMHCFTSDGFAEFKNSSTRDCRQE